ncbi:MAG: GNAT family N-acetyltransferase [Ruminococcaceae bacterium]|nr:GNAT family N-acetyltransferase [Oscillospiraceae bacterium]
MRDFFLRPTAESDIEQIIKIWKESFGDSEDFILDLAEKCRLIENGVCAESEGKARAFMFAFDGLEIQGQRASYIYGLCTQSEYRKRGLGQAVAFYAAQQASKRGSKLVFLRPADKKLEGWYASVLGAHAFAATLIEKVTPSLPLPDKAIKISAEEYLKARNNSLWRVPAEMIFAEETVHRHYGGAFLRCADCYICAELCGNGLFLREIIGHNSALAVSAAAEFFAADEVYLPCHSDDGIALMFIPPYIPENASSIPLMPFTLD